MGATSVCLITEGTYPYVTGGVSSWCQQLVTRLDRFDWGVLPIVPGSVERSSRFELPRNATLLPPIELWSDRVPGSRGRARTTLPSLLARGLMDRESHLPSLVSDLGWCREHSEMIRPTFRSREAWDLFRSQLGDIIDTTGYSVRDAAELYQTLYWVARTAATPIPEVDVLLPTAAGWPAIVAAAHKARHGTPVLLVEHGLYVREAYLGAVRGRSSPSVRLNNTRLSLGLTRLAYHIADSITPVTAAHAVWEVSIGASIEKITPVPNGIRPTEDVATLPGTRVVVTVGRIDPLKDILTMLRVAAEVHRKWPDARFIHYGPPSPGEGAYHEACLSLRDRLGMQEVFRFAGPVSDPRSVIREADVFLSTSISEGMPIAILEAMTEARPVVATSVGGVSDILLGSGLTAPPGDVAGLASSIGTLFRRPDLAAELGRCGADRVRRLYNEDFVVGAYERLIESLSPQVPA